MRKRVKQRKIELEKQRLRKQWVDLSPPITMKKHVEYLAQEHKILVSTVKGVGIGTAFEKTRLIVIPQIRGPVTYHVALHEIGHILKGRSKRVLEWEAIAWEYALQVSLFPPNKRTRRAIWRDLMTYYNLALENKRIHLPMDHHHLFWRLLEQLAEL